MRSALSRTCFASEATRYAPSVGTTVQARLVQLAAPTVSRRSSEPHQAGAASGAGQSAIEERIQLLELTWRKRLGRVRADSTADLLLRRLPGAPILTVRSAAELIGRSAQATNQAIARLAEAKVLSQTTVGRRNRAFEAPEVIRTFTALERQLASPPGDTRTAPPTRRVPRRD